MASGIVEIVPPLGGLDRALNFQGQPPYSTPSALNVRSTSAISGRHMVGSRPGLRKTYANYALGGATGQPVRMLNSVRPLTTEAGRFWQDNFDGTSINSGNWSAGTWTGAMGPVNIGDVVTAVSGATTSCAFTDYSDLPGPLTHPQYVRASFDDLDTAEPYAVILRCQPVFYAKFTGYSPISSGYIPQYAQLVGFQASSGATVAATTDLFLLMNDTAPNLPANGVRVRFYTNDGITYSIEVTKYVASVATVLGTSLLVASGTEPFNLRCLIDGTTLTTCINDEVLRTDTVPVAGHRMGFGLCAKYPLNPLSPFTADPPYVAIDNFNVSYTATKAESRERRIVASAGGYVYVNDDTGGMVAASPDLLIRTDRLVLAAEHLGGLFMADFDVPAVKGTTGAISGSGLILDDATVTDWSSYGITAAEYVVVITAGAGGTVNGTYKIAAINSGQITLTSSATNGTCSYSVERAPKVYIPDTPFCGIWTAQVGAVPSGCSMIALYLDCMVLAGGLNAPNQWFMSRQGAAYDWDYGAYDIQRAVSGAATQAGYIADRITALIPFHDDYMIFGCDTSLWVLRGHPAQGGIIQNLSRTVGVVSRAAWCEGKSGEIYILARNGLNVIPPGGGAPMPISQQKLPRELVNVDVNNYEVHMQYDVLGRGVHIFLTPNEVF